MIQQLHCKPSVLAGPITAKPAQEYKPCPENLAGMQKVIKNGLISD